MKRVMRFVTKRVLVALTAVLALAVFAVFGQRAFLPVDPSLAQAPSSPTPGNPLVGTPAPPPVVTPMTPGQPPVKPTPRSPAAMPTPKPDDAWHSGVALELTPTFDVEAAVGFADVIAVGRVKQVLPSRWTTPDGRRPANPFDPQSRAGIYTPVLLEVEQYLKGDQSRRELMVRASGGTVGRDSMDYEGIDWYTFVEGQRVLVFLVDIKESTFLFEGTRLPAVTMRFTLLDDGRAVNSTYTLSTQAILDDIKAALNK